MEIFKKIFAIVLISVFAISCNNDDDNNIAAPQTRKNLLLKTTDSDDGLTFTYTYDSNNRLANYTSNGSPNNAAKNQNFTYNTDGTLHKINEADGAEVFEFFYDADKKIIKKIGRNGLDILKYTYNGNIITVDYRFTTTNKGWILVYTYDANNNIAEIKKYSNTSDANPEGTSSSVTNYTYDDKNNVSSSLPPAFLFPSSVNNIKTSQYDGGAIESNQYEYNEDNYPIKRINSFTRIYEYKQL